MFEIWYKRLFEATRYIVPVGPFVMNGAALQGVVATANVPFDLTLVGVGLTDSDQISIIAENPKFRCGGAGSSTSSASVSGGSTKATLNNGTLQTWEEYKILKPGWYDVCWCGSGGSCTADADFLTYAGRFEVRGPRPRRAPALTVTFSS